MGYIKNYNVVGFVYDKDELFDSCCLQSSYISRNIKDKEGKYIGEDFVLTLDEREGFEECLRKCIPDICKVFSKISPKKDTFELNDEISIKVLNNGCDDKVLDIIDEFLRTVLVYGILKGWYELCGEANLIGYCSQVYTDKMKELWDSMFKMRIRN